MKKTLLLGIFFLLPFTSFAAPLTTGQATSLVNVVKSSPNTPASVFTNLITAFSNITNQQAESLITVVQSSPNAPNNIFVDMLIAFTIDTTFTKTSASSTGLVSGEAEGDNSNVEKLIPSSITVETRGNVYGGSCSQISFFVEVYDQYGNIMNKQPVSFFDPESSSWMYSTTTDNRSVDTFRFTPKISRGILKANFYVGAPAISPSINITANLQVKSLSEWINPSRILETQGKYVMTTAGMWYDTEEDRCVGNTEVSG